jgi:hypothetical protein
MPLEDISKPAGGVTAMVFERPNPSTVKLCGSDAVPAVAENRFKEVALVAIEGLTAEAELRGAGAIRLKSDKLLFESVSPLSLRIRDRVLPEKADAAVPS